MVKYDASIILHPFHWYDIIIHFHDLWWRHGTPLLGILQQWTGKPLKPLNWQHFSPHSWLQIVQNMDKYIAHMYLYLLITYIISTASPQQWIYIYMYVYIYTHYLSLGVYIFTLITMVRPFATILVPQ